MKKARKTIGSEWKENASCNNNKMWNFSISETSKEYNQILPCSVYHVHQYPFWQILDIQLYARYHASIFRTVAGDEIADIATPVTDSDSWRRGEKT